MPKVDKVTNGAPCWMELSTSDGEKAEAFYGDLFGWSAFDTGADFGHYTIMSKGEDRIAGMMPKGDGEQGLPDAWTIYFAVDDARVTAEAARSAGGQVVFDPMEVRDQGTMAVLTDPAGAFFGLWQPNVHTGFDINNEHGAPAWFELLTHDFAGAGDFYGTTLGVELADADFGAGGPAYKTINVGGEERAGIMDAANVLPEGVPSNWLIYFGVDDTDAAALKAVELGGSVLAPAADTPHGRFALLGDPTGAAFAVISV
jgi:uncharacterized protein